VGCPAHHRPFPVSMPHENDPTSELADDSLVRHEEQIADVDTTWRGIGYVRARKRVGTYRVKEEVPRQVEDVVLERTPVAADDSGKIERLEDGSISIPVFEEELVIEKRTILKERVIIRKTAVTEVERISAELRKERIEFDADPGIDLEIDEPSSPP
jgi:uncharacterized protein (TIGR02271 family)